MWATLAFRHLIVRPVRAAVLLAGFALGVAVMIVLLSVGDAMRDQSRDTTLVGGGQLTALPEGIDIEAMRTGGLTGMFFGIDGARYVTRELLGGPRDRTMVQGVAPEITQKLLQVVVRDSVWSVRAAGDIPSRASASGTALRLVAGRWEDTPADSAWMAPSRQAFYDEIDRFHAPPAGANSWAEWDYFTLSAGPGEWWYITLLSAAGQGTPATGGEVLVTHRRAGGATHRVAAVVGAAGVHLDTLHATQTIGSASVVQRDGVYHLRGRAGDLTFDLAVTPRRNEYFPPVEFSGGTSPAGYVVPILSGAASGKLCDGPRCTNVVNVDAYHDHNWGEWHDVTWEWGMGSSRTRALLYGGIIPGSSASHVPFVLALEDSLGLEQAYRFDSVEHIGTMAVTGEPHIVAPRRLRFTASHGGDTVTVSISASDAIASRSALSGTGRIFLQLRGTWRLVGRVAGRTVTDSGSGAYETWVEAGTLPRTLTDSSP